MRKGVSPIIATILLIAITVTLGYIIYSSASNSLTQLAPAPVCDKIAFNAGIHEERGIYFLEVTNLGNEIIEGFDILVIDDSLGQTDVTTLDLKLDPGQSISKEINLDIAKKDLRLVPRIKSQDEIKSCQQDYGKLIISN